MIASMTGFGRGEARVAGHGVAVEIKTLNQRHFEVSCKLPSGLWELEARIKQQLQAELKRGKAEVFLQWLGGPASRREAMVDVKLAASYRRNLLAAAKTLGLPAEPLRISWLAGLPEVVRLEERHVPLQTIAPLVDQAVARALKRVLAMRRIEGRRLAADIRQRLNLITRLTGQIGTGAKRSQVQQLRRLKARLQDWLSGVPVEERRQTFEALQKQVRGDITEELVRLRSHLAQFRAFLLAPEPAGRRLDFLLQEMNREINTVGSKSADAGVTHRVVAVKEELEKVREQVQNLE